MYCGRDSRSYARRMSDAQKMILKERNFADVQVSV